MPCYTCSIPTSRLMALVGLVFVGSSLIFAKVTRHDVIIMKNGDHMTREVKKLENGVLYIQTDYLSGSIGLDWLQGREGAEHWWVPGRIEGWTTFGWKNREGIGE